MSDHRISAKPRPILWVLLSLLLAGVVAAAWMGASLMKADRAKCEADGQHVYVRTYEGMVCMEGRKVKI